MTAPDRPGTPDGRTCSTPETAGAGSAAAPAPAAPASRPLEQLAIAAYGAWIGQTDAERVLLSWRQGNTDREAWRAAADAVRMMLDMPAAEPQPQAAPELADAMAETASRELAAAMRETRHYREALAEVASHDNDPITQVRIIARAARRALEGKP